MPYPLVEDITGVDDVLSEYKHSCESNTKLTLREGRIRLVGIKDIEEGEVLTLNRLTCNVSFRPERAMYGVVVYTHPSIRPGRPIRHPLRLFPLFGSRRVPRTGLSCCGGASLLRLVERVYPKGRKRKHRGPTKRSSVPEIYAGATSDWVWMVETELWANRRGEDEKVGVGG